MLCGCDKDHGQTNTSQSPANPPAVAATGTATLIGKISFDGQVPAPKVLSAAGRCHEGSPAVMDESLLVGADGAVQNVIVYLKDAPSGDGGGPPVVLDQKDCRYQPHVIALQVLQPLIIRNSDPQIHNVHLHCQINPEMNFGMLDQMDNPPISFKAPEFFMISCDVHSWMTAQAAVFDNPYFAVTGPDGTFRIDNCPSGTFTLAARQERLGELTQTVTLSDQKTATANFSFNLP